MLGPMKYILPSAAKFKTTAETKTPNSGLPQELNLPTGWFIAYKDAPPKVPKLKRTDMGRIEGLTLLAIAKRGAIVIIPPGMNAPKAVF